MKKAKIVETRETIEKRCTVNFVTAVLMTVLSIVLLIMSVGFHRQMRDDLASGKISGSVTGGKLTDVSAETTADQKSEPGAGPESVSDYSSDSVGGTNGTDGTGSSTGKNAASGAQETSGDETLEIPVSTLNYLVVYGVSFISAAAGMFYAYKTWKMTEKNRLVICSYVVFGLDIVSIFVGIIIRLNLI